MTKKEYQRQWRQKNIEKVRVYHREYSRKWRAEHKEEMRFYWRWSAMKNRCDNPNYHEYKNYGGRGIAYDPAWKDFKTFKKDMHGSYKPGLTLERIDVNGNYDKENCRWATRQEQAENKRCNIVITLNGESKTLLEWKQKLSIPFSYDTLRQRYYSGMKPEEILKTRLYRPAKLYA